VLVLPLELLLDWKVPVSLIVNKVTVMLPSAFRVPLAVICKLLVDCPVVLPVMVP
jgi:hypothetical protein